MQIVAIGSRVFVTSFQLAGVKGVKVETSAQALTEINKMDESSGIGLVLLSDDIGKDIRYQLTSLRAKRPIPLIFELTRGPSCTEVYCDCHFSLKNGQFVSSVI